MKTGIYTIVCLPTRKIYVGKAKDIRKRWGNHKSDLRLNKHKNRHLQSAWNKHQEDAFIFSIIRECSIEELDRLEKYYITKYDTTCDEKGFNMCLNCEEKGVGRNKIEKKKPRGRPIAVKRVGDLSIVGTYLSIVSAAVELGLNKNRIQEAASGKRYGTTWAKKTYKGYIFEYLENDIWIEGNSEDRIRILTDPDIKFENKIW